MLKLIYNKVLILFSMNSIYLNKVVMCLIKGGSEHFISIQGKYRIIYDGSRNSNVTINNS